MELKKKAVRLAFLIMALALIFGSAVQAGAGPGRAGAEKSFTLEQVLSPPYPMNLVAARSADRIAWIMNDRGARNVWTAAAPDFRPVRLTNFAAD